MPSIIKTFYESQFGQLMGVLQPPYPVAQIWYHLVPLVVLPLFALAILALWRPRARLSAVAAAAALALIGYFYVRTGNWTVFGPPAWRWGLAVAMAAGAAFAAWRAVGADKFAPGSVGGWIATATAAAAIAILAPASVALTLSAARAPADAVDVAFPLAGGRFHIKGGAGDPWLNHHGAPQERHALDIGELAPGGGLGARAVFQTNDDVQIFERDILSPCAGDVVHARDGIEDHAPYDYPDSGGLGNSVGIACQGVEIYLAHMRQGSVAVAEGDLVAAGDVLGRIGNSGFSMAPHLHINAVRAPIAADGASNADAPYEEWSPVPLTFGGRFLSTHDVVDAR